MTVKVPVLSVKMQSISPNYSKIEEFNTPQPVLVNLSYIFLSHEMKIVEKVLIPSMRILRVIGIRKFKSKKFVKNMMVANITYVFTL